MRRALALTAGVVAAGLAARSVAAGAITVDTGVGRRVRPLGPIEVEIVASREVVFDVIASPYLGRTPRAMAAKLEVLERGSDLVVAAHRTAVGRRLVATTVEAVRFSRPETVDFRLLRGPVPHVVERFTLHDVDGGTRLDYRGELGTDGWALGRRWGDVVARRWEAAVRDSLARFRDEAERRAR